MDGFERTVINKLDDIIKQFESVPSEDIVDIRQAYKTLVFTINSIGYEYNKLSKNVQTIVDNTSIQQTLQLPANFDEKCREVIVEEIRGIFSIETYIDTLSKKISSELIYTQKEVLTSDEAARYLGVSKSCLYKWTMGRQIPHYKSPTGKICFFNRKEIEAWMQSNRVVTDDELEQQAQKYCRNKKRV